MERRKKTKPKMKKCKYLVDTMANAVKAGWSVSMAMASLAPKNDDTLMSHLRLVGEQRPMFSNPFVLVLLWCAGDSLVAIPISTALCDQKIKGILSLAKWQRPTKMNHTQFTHIARTTWTNQTLIPLLRERTRSEKKNDGDEKLRFFSKMKKRRKKIKLLKFEMVE